MLATAALRSLCCCNLLVVLVPSGKFTGYMDLRDLLRFELQGFGTISIERSFRASMVLLWFPKDKGRPYSASFSIRSFLNNSLSILLNSCAFLDDFTVSRCHTLHVFIVAIFHSDSFPNCNTSSTLDSQKARICIFSFIFLR